MTNFSRSIIIAVPLGLLGLAGCLLPCGDTDGPPPQVTLSFSTDTLNGGHGFRRAEVRSAYLVRYKSPNFTDLADTLRQDFRGNNAKQVFAIFYNQALGPMAQVNEWVLGGPPRYDGYGVRSFRLVVPAAARSYALSNITVKTSHTKDRCPQMVIDAYDITIDGQVVDVRQGASLSK